MHSISVIGPGRLGGALAIALDSAGHRIDALVFRTRAPGANLAASFPVPPKMIALDDLTRLGSSVIIISTSDPQISTAAEKLKPILDPGTIILHTSGSLSSDILAPLREKGGFVGSIHPLLSVSDPLVGADSFKGCYFCIEGDPRAAAAAGTIASSLGGESFEIGSSLKSVYHAAAVMASGHLVALIDAAEEVIRAAGVPAAMSKKVLLPLISSTFRNVQMQDAQDALTGTFARGDLAALERHLSGLSPLTSQNVLNIYLELGERSLAIAKRRGGEASALDAMQNRIAMAKTIRE